MSQLLESTNGIRNALGKKAYGEIKKFGRYTEEDKLRRCLRKQLLDRYPNSCASCERKPKNPKDLPAAHILALEEGGKTTLENLVLLCSNCHNGLYDKGYVSCREMEATAASWRKGEICHLKEEMSCRKKQAGKQQVIIRPLNILQKKGVYDLNQRRWYGKALDRLKEVKNSDSDQVLTIIEAQIQRRRAARGAVETAGRLLKKVNLDQLSVDRKPLYFYELGYVKQLMGLTGEANDCFLESRQCALNLQDDAAQLEALIAEVQALATEVIAMSVVSPPPPSTVTSMIKRFDTAAQRAKERGGAFGGRWELNCKFWKVNLLFKWRNLNMASRAFEEVKQLRAMQNVTTGWTVSARPAITAMSGGLLLLEPNISKEQIKEGLYLLARALVPLLGGHRQRPEGIRDKLLGFEKGLDLLVERGKDDTQQLAKRISSVRERIRDGSSFIDPYQLTS